MFWHQWHGKIKKQSGCCILSQMKNPQLFLSSCASLQFASLSRRWSACWAGLSWWWAGGALVQSWPASSWSAWCLASLSPPPSSSLLSVGKNAEAPRWLNCFLTVWKSSKKWLHLWFTHHYCFILCVVPFLRRPWCVQAFRRSFLADLLLHHHHSSTLLCALAQRGNWSNTLTQALWKSLSMAPFSGNIRNDPFTLVFYCWKSVSLFLGFRVTSPPAALWVPTLSFWPSTPTFTPACLTSP